MIQSNHGEQAFRHSLPSCLVASVPFCSHFRLPTSALVLLLASLAAPALAGPVGAAGDLYIVSNCNEEIQQFDGPTGAQVGTFVAGGSGGLDNPLWLIFGPNGNLFVSSSSGSATNAVIEYDGSTGTLIGTFASGGGLDGPRGLAFGPNGNLFVGSHFTSSVLEYDGTTGAFVGTFASGGGLERPRGLAFGPNGNLVVSSQDTDEVIEYDGTTGALIGTLASGGGLNDPDGLTFGPNGNLFVASFTSDSVIEYDGTSGSLVGTFASEGLVHPTDLAFGPSGSLYVVASFPDDAVLQYNGDTGELIRTFADICSPMMFVFKPLTEPFPQPSITDFIPFSATNCGWLKGDSIQGTGLAWGAQVRLVRAGEPDILGAITITTPDDTALTAWFDLLGAAVGSWDLVLTYPDAQTATLVDALDVTACPQPQVSGIFPDQVVNCAALPDASITGGNFENDPRTEVHLSLAGQADIAGTNLSVLSGEIVADFDTFAAALGFWNVVVANPDGQTAVFGGGFEVSACDPPVVTDVVTTSTLNGIHSFSIDGQNFFPSDPLPMVTFRVAGDPDVVGQSQMSAPSPLTVSVDFGDAPLDEHYEVIVTRADGQSGTLSGVWVPRGRDVRITELGSWGGRINNLAVKDNVVYFHSGGRLVIADVSNPASPVELSSIDFRNHALAVAIRGNVLYVGGDRNTVCFRTFDISNPAAPVQLSKGCGFFGGSPRDIVFWNDIAYTLHGTDVHSFDITDPANPIVHQGVYFSLGGPMAVSGDYLFMLNDRAKLLVFDLGNAPDPFRPPLVTEFPLPVGRESGSIVIQGTFAYLQPWPPASSLVVVDISNPLAPSVVGTVPDAGPPSTNGIGEDGNNLAISNGILYVATGSPANNTVKLFDVGTSPASPGLVGTFTTDDAVITGMHVSGTTVYVQDEGEGVVMVDASNPANPVRLGNIHGPEWMRKEALVGDLLYVTDRWFGLTILDVSDPTHIPMVPIGVHQSGGDENWGIAVQGSLAYLSAGTGGLEILDVAVPSAPVLLGSFPAAPAFTAFDDLAVLDGIAYVGAHCCFPVVSFVLTLDVTDPANIILLDTLQIGSAFVVSEIEVFDNGVAVIVHALNRDISSVIVEATDPSNLILLSNTGGILRLNDMSLSDSGDFRYMVSNGTPPPIPGLFVHDVSDPSNPVQIGFTELGAARSVEAAGGFVFAEGRVFDVSDPTAPLMVADSLNNRTLPDFDILLDGPLMYGVSGINPAGVIINLIATPGDFNGDLVVGPGDLSTFVACLLGTDADPTHAIIADLNEDGMADGLDIPLFVAMLLDPPPPPVWGSCCLPDGTCAEDVTEPNCLYTLGGQYNGDNISCAAVICPPVGACCLPFGSVTCDERAAFACAAVGGSYQGDFTTCVTTLCPFGACCFIDDGSCLDRNPTLCAALAGDYRGDGTDCASTVCPFGQYSNEVSPITQVALAGAGLQLADDLTLAGIGARDLVSLDLAVFGGSAGGGPFDVTVSLYTDCPGAGGTLIPGTTFNWLGVPDDGFARLLVVDPVSPAVTIPDTVWMTATFTTPQSGWIIAEQAEVGTTANLYARNNPWTCNATFGGAPHAGLWANLVCIEGSARAAAPAGQGSPTEPTLRMIKLEAETPPTLQTLGGE